MKEEIERLYKNFWITKGSRFIAAKRLEHHDNLSNISITLASVYVIIMNLTIILPVNQQPLSNDLITYTTICLSILILVISLIVSSKNYKMRAKDYHDCGREIKKIYDIVTLWRNSDIIPNQNEIKKIQNKYNNILDKYENHKTIDYEMFQSKNLSDFKLKYPRYFLVQTKILFYKNYLLYIIIILSPLLCLLK